MIYIMCFDGEVAGQRSSEIIARHIPFWLKHQEPLVFVSPADAPYISQHTNIHAGKRGYGPGTGEQFQAILSHIAKHGDGIIFEYDAFCMDPPSPPFFPGIWGNVFVADYPYFVIRRYANAPWIIDQKSAALILEASKKWFNLGYWDNDVLLCSWASLASVPLIAFNEQGFSRPTITTGDRSAIESIKPCPRWIHGIKHKDTLDMIMDLFQK